VAPEKEPKCCKMIAGQPLAPRPNLPGKAASPIGARAEADECIISLS